MITQLEIDTLGASITPILMSANKGLKSDKMDIKEVYASAAAAFRISDPTPTYCGDLGFSLVPDPKQPFLTLD